MPRRLLPLITLVSMLLASCAKDKPVDPGPPATVDTTDQQPPAAPDTVELTDKVLTDHLEFPWEILWGSDNSIWMTERPGRISRVDPGSGAVTPVFTIPDISLNSEAGLLGMVLHPSFATTPQVFVTYTYMKGSQFTEKVVRYTFDGTTLKDPLVLVDGITAFHIHDGSRLAIGPDNTLYISTGDADDHDNPQDSARLNGKILRVNLDGSIPADNPVPGSPVWTIGHRNPEGLAWVGDKLYSSEHGPDTDDEINIIQKGGNYGWPDVAGFCDKNPEASFCAAHNVVEPIKAWTPTIAPSGLAYYDAEMIPQFRHSLLLAILKDSRLLQLKLSDDGDSIVSQTDLLVGKYGRMRDVCVSPEGKVYICTSNGTDDKIIELSAKAD